MSFNVGDVVAFCKCAHIDGASAPQVVSVAMFGTVWRLTAFLT